MNIKNQPFPARANLDYQKVSIFKGSEPIPFIARQYERGMHIQKSMHQHPESEICFMPSDSGVMLIEGMAYPFCPGDMFLIPGNTYHQPVFDSQHNQGLVVVYFSPHIVDQLPNNWSDLKTLLHSPHWPGLQMNLNIQATKLLMEMRELLQRDEEGIDIICQGTFLHLLSYFRRELKKQDLYLSQNTNALMKKFSKTINYIHSNIAHNIDLAELTCIAGMSRSRFYEQFKECFGMTANQYIQHARVEKSKELLCHTALSITEIAYACGFNWPSFFNRVFKKSTGTYPSSFRKYYQCGEK
ncbi:MAG: AraC family transcriptional regulator [Pseudomonadota bacterium]